MYYEHFSYKTRIIPQVVTTVSNICRRRGEDFHEESAENRQDRSEKVEKRLAQTRQSHRSDR